MRLMNDRFMAVTSLRILSLAPSGDIVIRNADRRSSTVLLPKEPHDWTASWTAPLLGGNCKSKTAKKKEDGCYRLQQLLNAQNRHSMITFETCLKIFGRKRRKQSQIFESCCCARNGNVKFP